MYIIHVRREREERRNGRRKKKKKDNVNIWKVGREREGGREGGRRIQ